MITTNTEPGDELFVAADALLAAAEAYHRAYIAAGLRAAVVWIEDTDGRLVILTRGEYRSHLMENIHTLPKEAVVRAWNAAGAGQVSSSRSGIAARIAAVEQLIRNRGGDPVRFSDLLHKMREQQGDAFGRNHLVTALKDKRFVRVARGYTLAAPVEVTSG